MQQGPTHRCRTGEEHQAQILVSLLLCRRKYVMTMPFMSVWHREKTLATSRPRPHGHFYLGHLVVVALALSATLREWQP